MRTTSADGAAKLWNAATGECTQTFTGHGGWVFSVVFSAYGAAVLTASDDGTAKLWNPSTGESSQTLTGHGAVVDYLDCFRRCHCQALKSLSLKTEVSPGPANLEKWLGRLMKPSGRSQMRVMGLNCRHGQIPRLP